jgi:hypothetical protein
MDRSSASDSSSRPFAFAPRNSTLPAAIPILAVVLLNQPKRVVSWTSALDADASGLLQFLLFAHLPEFPETENCKYEKESMAK